MEILDGKKLSNEIIEELKVRCDELKEKGINIREKVSKENIVVRWTLYYILILIIIVFGAYGFGYAPVDPIYANF